MNMTKTSLTLSIQTVIEHTGEYGVKRDDLIELLESWGWNVNIENEEDIE